MDNNEAYKEQLMVQRYGYAKFEDGYTTVVPVSGGEFVKAVDVRLKILRMVALRQLSSVHATRILDALGL